MATIFNDFFVNVADGVSKRIPRSPKSPLDYLHNQNPHSFFITPAAPQEVSDVIDLLKTGKSLGPNSIPIKLLKILSSNISSTLLSLQHAKVIPLFKKGCSMTVSNYRPISLLSVFSKITEKLMYKRLYSFLEIHKILYNLQFCFRASHSVNHALISLTKLSKTPWITNTLDVESLLTSRKPLILSITKSS